MSFLGGLLASCFSLPSRSAIRQMCRLTCHYQCHVTVLTSPTISATRQKLPFSIRLLEIIFLLLGAQMAGHTKLERDTRDVPNDNQSDSRLKATKSAGNYYLLLGGNFQDYSVDVADRCQSKIAALY
jgi:hypothetical protein